MTSKGFSVGIIGAGPGGLALGIFLSKTGFRDFTIFDREDGIGGTWRINTYPPGLRREVAPVFILVRSERELVAAVVGSAGDPGLLRAVRTTL